MRRPNSNKIFQTFIKFHIIKNKSFLFNSKLSDLKFRKTPGERQSIIILRKMFMQKLGNLIF